MHLPKAGQSRVALLILVTTALFAGVGFAAGVKPESRTGPRIQLESLDRGLIAAKTANGVFLSWRLRANEVTGYGKTGLTGVNFNVYRDGAKIATVTDSTNYLDSGASAASQYYVRAVFNQKEREQSATVTPWSNNYYELPLQKPADGITPSGVTYTYSANDISVGDVDGDGRYEYFVKWDPSNSKDVSQKGYTGKVYLDCYRMDGTLLYRIDLGVNIRAGAHYTQFLVYDFDGNGKAELMFKTAPGTKIIKYQNGQVRSEKYITLTRKDVAAGYSNNDDYRVSSTDYYNHLVKMFMGWRNQPEVVNGNWPQTIEGCLGITPQYSYPLSQSDAEKLATYFIDVYAPSRSAKNVLREFEGFILSGPEYLTVFNGATGDELQTIPYKPRRNDDGLRWGDYAMARIEPCNRVDRFLAGVAYLDGVKPYAIFCRGYYTRSTLVSYSWDGKRLKEKWYVDSGWTQMSNPFKDSPHGVDGSAPKFKTITTQGAHSMSVADVDGDGKQEVVYGSATIDHNGRLLYSSTAAMPAESALAGTVVRLGHGDALHVTDIDPQRPGLEIYMCHEGGTSAPYGYSLRDAKTGAVIYGAYAGTDVGRAMIGDIVPNQRGLETWSSAPSTAGSQLWSANGLQIGNKAPTTNMNIKWAADLTTQIVDGALEVTPTIVDWQKGVVLTAFDSRTNNSTKGNPCLVADIWGDWREELLLRKADSSAVRIYFNTEVSNHKLYTLMHDPQYRVEVARQNTTYNQPAYTSFYFGSDVDWSKVPLPRYRVPNPECQNSNKK